MDGQGRDLDDVGRLIETQREFYDLRAPDFRDEAVPDRRISGAPSTELCRALVDELAPTGDVLELACGPGAFTRELLRHAATVTAVDGSARMLERNQAEVRDSRVRYVHADLFRWRSPRRYDAVFFSFWLSHVPLSRFDEFWATVRASLRPEGRVGFVDEDDRGSVNDDIRLVGDVPVARRTLRDGRQLDVIKLYWHPRDLEARLRALGWTAEVRPVGNTFLYGALSDDGGGAAARP